MQTPRTGADRESNEAPPGFDSRVASKPGVGQNLGRTARGAGRGRLIRRGSLNPGRDCKHPKRIKAHANC